MALKLFSNKEKTITDLNIISNIITGENLDATIKQLYQETYGMVENMILKNFGRSEDAEDIFQESLMVLMDNIESGKFQGNSTVKTYLYSICRNMWRDLLKKRSKFTLMDSFFDKNIEDEEKIDRMITYSENERIFEQAASSLGTSCFEILKSFYFEELSIPELLKKYSDKYTNEQVIRNKKSKCLKAMRSKLDKYPMIKEAYRDNLKTLQ
ncbi:RNA polymerase sigma factor [Aureibacter tunicatorum]|uniref:RNA polymerase sigma factor (Sigma-70 family) n=1 Tax=Aureibacter tunicatorum TaxID=866807 RepID=A0AAE3XU15_9BACT|nr:sigma-70 family RNA polymerase sigma factor [Aureibacter tunicatorum]MDR6242078.1 RNA polymerase sigma factor (sigma-70 family) [Aureibacter tunicatorum]BDD07552.1 hypothetical protein AUTU_50350 [Aureibacter tunicatorum]